MEKYDIKYEILNYDKYYDRLNKIENNPNNKFKVVKEKDLGYTSCGFPIEHYSIGEGPMHIVYMSGAHGNEIIGVDYVTQLMNNIALGNGEYQNFDPSLFTIDFIPCQNPEGFFTTTYALSMVTNGMTDDEIEAFSKEYWKNYRSDDINVSSVNKVINAVCDKKGLDKTKLGRLFWKHYNSKDIRVEDIKDFFKDIESETFIEEKWQEILKDKEVVEGKKKHTEMFNEVTLECIPARDEAHINLKNALTEMYQNGDFPLGTLANFFANSEGVNLNDNTENYFNILKERMEKEGDVYANSRDNHLKKSIKGPVGMASKDMNGEFVYASENKALFDFLDKQAQNHENYAFINCHGTGGLLYLYPFAEDDMEEARTNGVTRNFNFYINNRISTEYVKATGKTYEEKTGEYSPYKQMGHPDEIVGVGDYLRSTHLSSFLLELSKMGGNPLGPYGDKNGNYQLTMEANMDAGMKLLETVLEVSHLYDLSYGMRYDDNNQVIYSEKFTR